MKPSISSLVSAMKRKKYAVFNKGDYNLNLVGIRSADMNANTFNDLYCVFFQCNVHANMHVFPCTTDPGLYYRYRPVNLNGTAILIPGQYRRAWKLGRHQGRYDALVQAQPVSVYRDNDRNKTLNTNVPTQTGYFGINHHRANAARESTQVDKWSAGCQVFASPDDYRIFMALIKKAAALWGNSFTYTLLNEEDL